MCSNDLAAAVVTCQKDITAVGSGVVKQRGNLWFWPKTRRAKVMALARKLGTIAQAVGLGSALHHPYGLLVIHFHVTNVSTQHPGGEGLYRSIQSRSKARVYAIRSFTLRYDVVSSLRC